MISKRGFKTWYDQHYERKHGFSVVNFVYVTPQWLQAKLMIDHGGQWSALDVNIWDNQHCECGRQTIQ